MLKFFYISALYSPNTAKELSIIFTNENVKCYYQKVVSRVCRESLKVANIPSKVIQ